MTHTWVWWVPQDPVSHHSPIKTAIVYHFGRVLAFFGGTVFFLFFGQAQVVCMKGILGVLVDTSAQLASYVFLNNQSISLNKVRANLFQIPVPISIVSCKFVDKIMLNRPKFASRHLCLTCHMRRAGDKSGHHH